MRARSRPPTELIAFAIVFAGFLAGGIASGGGPDGTPGGGEAARAAVREVAPIAHRVERIRGLRFKHLPRPVVVTPGQAAADQLRQLDRGYGPRRRHADEELLELLGLVPPGTDIRSVASDVSSGEVAGYYDTERGRLAIVDAPATRAGVLTEITLAHELTHALEDQRFGLEEKAGAGADDGSSAYSAMVEGTATAVMSEYARRYVNPTALLGASLGSLGEAEAGAKSVPPYIQRTLEFSYTAGQRWVEALRRGRGWRRVNAAERRRPPDSTEQVIHPDKYLRRERPAPAPIADPGLGRGWRRATRGTMGELDTRELLRLGTDDASATTAAAGWGGGRYAMWTNARAARGCARPCRAADVLVLRWTWDTARDAREFDTVLPLYLAKGLHAGEAGAARWRVGSGGAAIGVRGLTTTLAFAPSPPAAERLAARAARGP